VYQLTFLVARPPDKRIDADEKAHYQCGIVMANAIQVTSRRGDWNLTAAVEARQ